MKFLRQRVFIGLIAFGGGLAGISLGQSEEALAAKDKREAEFAKAVEDYSAWWVKEMAEPRAKLEEELFDTRIEELQESMKLTDEQVDVLKKAGAGAIKQSQPHWEESALQYQNRLWKQRTGQKAVALVDSSKRSIERASDSSKRSMVSRVGLAYEKRPHNLESWKKAVKSILSPDQIEKWEKEVAEEQHERKTMISAAAERYKSKMDPVLKPQLNQEVGWLKKTFSIVEDREASLEKLVQKVVDTALTKIGNTYKTEAELLSTSDLNLLSSNRRSISIALPNSLAESQTWREGLVKFLSEEENETWASELERLKSAEKAELEDSAEKVIKSRAVTSRITEKRKVDLIVQDISNTLSLDPGKKKELDVLAGKALDAYEKDWSQMARDYLDSVSELRRKQMIQQGSVYVRTSDSISALNQKVWTEGLKDVLSGDAVARWEDEQKRREDRRIESFGGLIVMKMDEVIGLNQQQRSDLLPILSKIGNDQYLKSYRGRAVSVSTSTISRLLKNDSDMNKIRPLLEPAQVKQLHAWVETKSARPFSGKFERASKSPLPETDEAYVEEAIGSFLFALMKNRRAEYVNHQVAKVDALDRLVNLTEEQKSYLIIAAKGNSQVEIDEAISKTADSIRSSVQNVSRDEIYNRLSQFATTRVGSEIPPQNGIWLSAIERILTPEQQALREEFVSQQRDFRDEAIIRQVLSNAEISLHLTSEQVETLTPKIQSILTKYGADIDKSFVSSSPWFYNSTYSLLPLAAIQEKELNEILTKKQVDQWKERHVRTVSIYWQRVEASRRERAGNEENEEEGAGVPTD